MVKSLLLVSAGALLFAPFALSGRAPQEAAAPPQQPAAADLPATTPSPQAAPAAAGIPIDTRNPVKPTAASQAKAKEIYAIDCAMCHGADGKGKTDLATSMGLTLPDFTVDKSLADQPDGALFNLIRDGKDKMPGEDRARANDDVVWNVVWYVRAFSHPQLVPAAATK